MVRVFWIIIALLGALSCDSSSNGGTTPSGIGKVCEGSQDCPGDLVCDSENGSLICTKTCTENSECDGASCVDSTVGSGTKWCKP